MAACGLGRLEEEALRRKERLNALREKTGRKAKEESEAKGQHRKEEEGEPERHRELKLRNYVPQDEELRKRKVPQARPASVEEKVKDQLEAAKPEPIIDEVGPEKRRGQEAGQAGEEDPEGHSRADPGATEGARRRPGVRRGLRQTGGKRFGLTGPVGAHPSSRRCPVPGGNRGSTCPSSPSRPRTPLEAQDRFPLTRVRAEPMGCVGRGREGGPKCIYVF
ncbi:coiled-coil domain-containing protein 12 isoform X1 [Tachyglossus aculeatus]|uniref:coiled-coil domain-containing protein 12 isoform X1 n=1 Tax=Tachyglossus aculeatus TaxID=9261 RepID=UPI0018F5239E|nr:coiled-coil domain-containing protein 12 isoform X1 [Tachyglossus aculeatus]